MGEPCHNQSYRPRVASLLSLASPVQDAPSATALARIETQTRKPFKDISSTPILARWTCSIHVFPAAYPRSLSGSSVHELIMPNYPKSSDGAAIASSLKEQNLMAQRRTESSKVDEPQLFISAARYFIESDSEEKKKLSGDETGSNTLILAHANGFHKETWEPMLAHLLSSTGGRKLQEIWALDCVNQGDSAVLNRQNAGLAFDWADNVRDLMNFILCYLPCQRSCGSKLPLVLPRLECPNPSLLSLDKAPGPTSPGPIHWRQRRLGLIGHSLGGCSTALAATSIPELFHDVIIIDPIIRAQDLPEWELATSYANRAAVRRQEWENRSIALEKFKQNKNFYGRWDPAVLTRYIQHAIEYDGKLAKLKCHPIHETVVFNETNSRAFTAYMRLLNLFRESQQDGKKCDPAGDLPFKFYMILGNQKESLVPEEILLSHPNLYKFKLSIRVLSSGHLIVQENPMELAFLISKHLEQPRAFSHIKKHNCTPSKL